MTSIGNAVWVQSQDENDPSLEITIPVVLPAGVRTKELSVSVKDSEVLCIKYKESSLVQWRLYSQVSDEVEWRTEGDNVVVDVQKSNPATWPSLLNVPMRADDRHLATEAELDELFKKEVKPLPPVKAKPASKPAEEGEQGALDEDELDRLLEETVQEVEQLDVYVKAELKGMEEEEGEMRAKLQEFEENLATTESDEEREKLVKHIHLLESMLQIHAETRELRSKECTLQLFLQTQLLDLKKSRVNIGELSDSEAEAFASSEERELTATQLMQLGLQHLQEQNLEHAIHYLRLAAVHYKHPQSTSLLFRIYTELGSPRGAYLLLQRAKDDEDMDITTNLQVAEMFDKGARHFPPIFGAAVHFYQRAARCGSTHAMIGLAQLYLRGSTSATTLNEEERAANINKAKYHAWLEQAIDRGSGAALFIKGCMHLRGEHGLEKSYKLAKSYLERAGKCQPDIMRRATGVNAALEKLRVEEEAAASPSSPATPASPMASPASGGSMTSTTNNGPKVDIAARLAALEQQSAGADTYKKPTTSKKASTSHAAASARSRVFWERAATTSTAIFCIYTLAFPLRVMLMGPFYSLVQWFVDSFGFSLGGGDASPRGLML